MSEPKYLPANQGMLNAIFEFIQRMLIIGTACAMAVWAVSTYLKIHIEAKTLDMKDVVIIVGFGYTVVTKFWFGGTSTKRRS